MTTTADTTWRRLAGLLLALLATTAIEAAQDYRYIEGERYSAEQGSGLRQEGFTPWMAHPSNAAVMILGAPGNWLEYEVKGLEARPYHLFVRGLAWAKGCEVDAYWDGAKIGATSYPQAATALRWSNEVATVNGPGDHRLRLVRAPGTIQAPYLDVILLTTQDGLRPDDADHDFLSYTTDLPPLSAKTGQGEAVVLPLPSEGPISASSLSVVGVALDPPGIGTNAATVRLTSTEAMQVQVSVGLQGAAAGIAEARLAGQGAEVSVTVPWRAGQPGPARLELAVSSGGRRLVSGAYPVMVSAPVSVSLDQYAYPVGTAVAVWTPVLSAGADVGAALGAEIQVQAVDGDPAALLRLQLPPGAATATQTLPLTGLSRGRYEVLAKFVLGGQPLMSERREFILFDPLPAESWEAVRSSAASGPILLLNGKPFLGRLLFHAAANATTRGQGFNLVQCSGGDPNPLESIQKHLDQCAQNGLWGMVALFNNRFFLPDAHFDTEHLRAAVTRFRGHPALFGWDLVDEPDGRDGMSPAEVTAAARLVRELDPNHVIWVNLCRYDQALTWLEAQDLWSFDAYPFPTQGFAGYAPWLKISDANLRGRRSLGTCLQTFQYSQEIPMTTPDQLRASAWLHILHGYTWFGYYSYFDPEPAGCLARAPVLWSYCRALNTELQAMQGVIMDPTPWQRLDLLDARDSAVEAALKEQDGRRYVIAVSGARESRRLQVRLPGGAAEAEVLLDRSRRLPLREGVLEAELRPYGTLICRLVDGRRQP